MLVISRSPGEQIRIGEDVVIEVLEVRGNKVRIGVIAPSGVSVHRAEVWCAMRDLAQPRDLADLIQEIHAHARVHGANRPPAAAAAPSTEGQAEAS